MAKTSSLDAALGGLVDRLADRLADRLTKVLKNGTVRGAPAAVGKRRRPGRKLDMSCRVSGCKNRSRGPRFGFICDDHRKSLSKKEQQAARDAWNNKKSQAA